MSVKINTNDSKLRKNDHLVVFIGFKHRYYQFYFICGLLFRKKSLTNDPRSNNPVCNCCETILLVSNNIILIKLTHRYQSKKNS